MGRIDEALRRAARDGAAPVSDGGAQRPGDDAFVSPWSFESTPAQTPTAAAPAQGAPAESPFTLITTAPRGPADTLALFRSFDPAVEERIVVGKGAPPALAERFRRLAATLHHAQLVQGIKVVMVTSPDAGDGKTLTSANLALTLSESYRREVLLIDGDLRRPSLHQVFRVPNVAGLNEGLKAGAEDKLSALKVTPTLTLLPAGRPDPDPMSGLTSQRMRRILEEAAGRFEWVIIDTPPIGLLPDASLLATMVDGALFVVRAGRTPHTSVVRAIEAFGRERILGIILNGAEQRSEDDNAAHYYTTPPDETS
jgi:capsular exopolysaccharide synthesis family protein